MAGQREIRVCVIIPSLAIGGAERQALQACEALRDSGAKVALLALLKDEVTYQAPEGLQLVEISAGKKEHLPRIKAILKLMREFRPTHVATFGVPPNITGRLLKAVKPGIKLITSIRTGKLKKAPQKILSATKGLDSATVFNAQTVLDEMCQAGVAVRTKSVHIPNSVAKPSGELDPGLRKSLGIPDGDFLWGIVGRFAPVKNHRVLIESGAGTWLKSSRLLLVGDGQGREDLESLCRSLGVADRVHFVGVQYDLARWLGAMDGFVLSSLWEGMPNSLLEAMLTGLPSVSTRVGGVPDIIRHGETGWMAPPGDGPALAQVMEEVLRLTPDQRRTVGEAGRQLVESLCSPAAVKARWVDLVRSLA